MKFFDIVKRTVVAFCQKENPNGKDIIKNKNGDKRGGNKKLVFDAIEKNFLQKPCSIDDVLFVLGGKLKRSQISHALQDLHEDKKIHRVSRGVYAFSSMQEIKKNNEIKPRKNVNSENNTTSFVKGNQQILTIYMPITFYNEICDLAEGENLNKIVSPLITEHLAKGMPLSQEELKIERESFVGKKKYYNFFLSREIYQNLKSYSLKSKCSMSVIIRYSLLRWCKEQKECIKGLTVARSLRMKKYRDLRAFCQFAGIDNVKYKYWELGESGCWWTLGTTELIKVAKLLNTHVENIATADGKARFL